MNCCFADDEFIVKEVEQYILFSKVMAESLKTDLIIDVYSTHESLWESKIKEFELEKKKLIDEKDLEAAQKLDNLKQQVLDFIKKQNKSNSQQTLKNN